MEHFLSLIPDICGQEHPSRNLELLATTYTCPSVCSSVCQWREENAPKLMSWELSRQITASSWVARHPHPMQCQPRALPEMSFLPQLLLPLYVIAIPHSVHYCTLLPVAWLGQAWHHHYWALSNCVCGFDCFPARKTTYDDGWRGMRTEEEGRRERKKEKGEREKRRKRRFLALDLPTYILCYVGLCGNTHHDSRGRPACFVY